ncbi:MAG: hypothetical protein V7K55_03160 [Nostoc sp.]|uniref:hypothetical protein n=1 Tax=Nostoc sp. TaxID=1180 RepID=UPI002FFCE2C2
MINYAYDSPGYTSAKVSLLDQYTWVSAKGEASGILGKKPNISGAFLVCAWLPQWHREHRENKEGFSPMI